MAVREKSIFVANEIYFITFTIFDWQKIFISDKYCQLVFKWFNYTKDEYQNKIYGYVIMPNHIHILMRISEKSPKLSILIMNAKRFLAQGIIKYLEDDNNLALLKIFKTKANVNNNAKYKVFTDRYDSLLIQSEKFFFEKLNYIHNNPCQGKWSLVDNPEDYIYSSASNYILDRGFYPVEIMDF